MNPEMPYNTYSDDAIDAIAQGYADHYLSRVEIVKMDEQRPANDILCRHETLIADKLDTMDDGSVYHGCANPKCGVGFYIQPTRNKNIT